MTTTKTTRQKNSKHQHIIKQKETTIGQKLNNRFMMLSRTWKPNMTTLTRLAIDRRTESNFTNYTFNIPKQRATKKTNTITIRENKTKKYSQQRQSEDVF